MPDVLKKKVETKLCRDLVAITGLSSNDFVSIPSLVYSPKYL